MSMGRLKDREYRMVPKPNIPKPESQLASTGPTSNALVEYTSPVKEDDEYLEIKLRRIIDNVPVRVSNTSGSSAGSGSGDFYQVQLIGGCFVEIGDLDYLAKVMFGIVEEELVRA